MRGCGAVLGIVQRRRQHGDVAGDLAQAEILHQHLAELLQRRLLVLAVHRRAGIDHVAQRGMVVRSTAGCSTIIFRMVGTVKMLRDAVLLDQPERLVDIEALRPAAGWSARRGRSAPAGGRRRHATAAQTPGRRRPRWCRASGRQRWLVITNAIWPWVSTAAFERPVVPEVKKNQQGSSYSTLASSTCRAGCAAMTSLTDFRRSGPRRCARRRRAPGCAASPRPHVGKVAVAQERLGARRPRQVGDLVRHQAEIGWHPDRAEPEGGEHRPEHLVAILGMDQDTVTLDDAARRQRRRQRGDAGSISRQVHERSPMMKPTRSPCRREFCVIKCARFMTRRDIRLTPPVGVAGGNEASLTVFSGRRQAS